MMKSNKKIIIFGAGSNEKNITTYITENYKNIIGIVDNDCKKWSSKINGYSIMNPEFICNYLNEKNAMIVIATYRHHEEIKEQLNRLGWDSERVVVAIHEIPFFNSMGFSLYLNNSDLLNPRPTELNIELSGYCNCKCFYCPFHGEAHLKDGHKGFMDWKTMDAIIDAVKKIPSIKTVNTTGPGEIFLNKNWFEMVEKLLENTSIDNVIMYTNGMLLTKENAEKIVLLNAKKIIVEVSIDGETPDENDEYRIGSKYTTIRENIQTVMQIFSESEKKIELMITNCYPAKMNEIESTDFKAISRYNAVPMFLQNDFKGIALLSQKTFSYGKEYVSKFKTVEVELPENEKVGCTNLFYRLPIDFEGGLLRCSCGSAGIEAIGSVFTDDILELWYNDKQIQRARKNFIENNWEEDFCTGCPGKGIEKFTILVKDCE